MNYDTYIDIVTLNSRFINILKFYHAFHEPMHVFIIMKLFTSLSTKYNLSF